MKPIIFNTEMLRAILDGRKTQTRRLHGFGDKTAFEVGDVLYIRETWAKIEDDGCYVYKADFPPEKAARIRWHPSIHMPKEAARLFLRVTSAKIERLQDITGMDCVKEGVSMDALTAVGEDYARGIFSDIWDGTIEKDDLDKNGWDANPFVDAYEFEVIEA